MKLTQKEIKQRYFDKVYNAAPMVECACGCGIKIKSKDRYGRDKKFENGHNGRKYEDPTEYKRAWNRKRRSSKKVILILYKGGKCKQCRIKYDGENGSIFDFHHLTDKQFGISAATIWKTIEELKAEVDKCELLCSNCHRLKHNGKF